MNLGELGSGCPDCGRGLHEGPCPPFLPRFPENRTVREGALPPLSIGQKVGLWALGVIALCVVMSFLIQSDKKERDEWRADWKRRTEQCEALGGIPRYQVRGRSYDGCDFPPKEAR